MFTSSYSFIVDPKERFDDISISRTTGASEETLEDKHVEVFRWMKTRI